MSTRMASKTSATGTASHRDSLRQSHRRTFWRKGSDVGPPLPALAACPPAKLSEARLAGFAPMAKAEPIATFPAKDGGAAMPRGNKRDEFLPSNEIFSPFYECIPPIVAAIAEAMATTNNSSGIHGLGSLGEPELVSVVLRGSLAAGTPQPLVSGDCLGVPVPRATGSRKTSRVKLPSSHP